MVSYGAVQGLGFVLKDVAPIFSFELQLTFLFSSFVSFDIGVLFLNFPFADW